MSAIAIERESTIMDQPRGVQLEYRVKTVKTGGEGVPRNSVAVKFVNSESFLAKKG